jgi:hypothetical protein
MLCGFRGGTISRRARRDRGYSERVTIGEVAGGDILYAGVMVGQPGVYQVTVAVQIGGFTTPPGGYLAVVGPAEQQ